MPVFLLQEGGTWHSLCDEEKDDDADNNDDDDEDG